MHSKALTDKKSNNSDQFRSPSKKEQDEKEDFNWKLFTICKEIDSFSVPGDLAEEIKILQTLSIRVFQNNIDPQQLLQDSL